MSRFFRRKEREPSIASTGSTKTAGSRDTRAPRGSHPQYLGEEPLERTGSFLINRFKDMKSRWGDIMNVDDLLQDELSDARLHPEIQWTAELRRSNDLCDAETALVKARRKRAVKQLRRFLQIPDEEEIDERDIPIIGLGGSGGGFRAMLGFLATMEAAKEAGMWDLIMYTAGVSGSCWALGSYYTWGEMSTKRCLAHYAKHSQHHPLSPKAMRETMKSPRGAYYLLAPLQWKHLAGLSQTLMDVYGSFVTAYLWLPSKEEAVTIWKDRLPSLHREWFRWSSVAPKISKGEEPMPILTAIRHERPWKAWKDKEAPFESEDHNDKEHRMAQDAWWQWYEFSPFEFGCDELKYWIPIWAFGRPFKGGRSVKSLPEHSLSCILGLCTSAPAAPMSIYLGTIQRSLPKGWIEGSIDNISGAIAHLWGQHETKVFEGRHPVHAANEHNPLFHASPSPRPPGIENAQRIHMLDSGISNNSPTYAFLHPSRGCDIILNFDASSDVMTEAAPARNQEMGDMKGLLFTKRAHPFPLPPSAAARSTEEATAASEPDVTNSASLSLAPSTPSEATCIDPQQPSRPAQSPIQKPSSSYRHESNNGGKTRDQRRTNLRPAEGGAPEPTEGKNQSAKKQAFEKARAEDVKRKEKAAAEGWTAESIEREFSGRYAQIFDGVPTHPSVPLAATPKPANGVTGETQQPPPPIQGGQQPGSLPYNISKNNVPLATRPVSLVYMPLFPNKVNPGYDPTGAAFSGSYNLKWNEEQVQTIRKTAKANFGESLEVIRLVIREGYQRRKGERLARQTAAAKGEDLAFGKDDPIRASEGGRDEEPEEEKEAAAVEPAEPVTGAAKTSVVDTKGAAITGNSALLGPSCGGDADSETFTERAQTEVADLAEGV